MNRIGPHSKDVISVLVGCILGDAYASRRGTQGTRFAFRQSIKHKEYLFTNFLIVEVTAPI
jgi:hypothetical protein